MSDFENVLMDLFLNQAGAPEKVGWLGCSDTEISIHILSYFSDLKTKLQHS